MCLYNVFLSLSLLLIIHPFAMQSDFPKCLELQFYSPFLSHCSNFTFVKIFLNKQWKRVKSSRADQRQPPNGTVAHGKCHVVVVVHLDLREIKFVLLLSYQIFKLIVERYWERLTDGSYTSGAEDKEAWFSTVGVDEGSIDIL